MRPCSLTGEPPQGRPLRYRCARRRWRAPEGAAGDHRCGPHHTETECASSRVVNVPRGSFTPVVSAFLPSPAGRSEVTRWPSPPGGDVDPFEYYPQLRKVRDYVERNLMIGVTARGAAAAAGVCPGYFSSFFRQRVGTTFGQWFRTFRITRARSLMLSAPESILDVAFLSGYGSLSAFERAFKMETRLSPTAWLEQQS